MNVTRIEDNGSSWVEPPLDQDWPDRKKLEWHAAVTEHDEGIRVEIRKGSFKRLIRGVWVEGERHYTVIIGNSSTVHNFQDAWTYINGATAGAHATRP